MKRALICGISGQDGAYLTRLLLEKSYEVIGTSRNAEANNFGNLKKLGLRECVDIVTMRPNDFEDVLSVLNRTQPDEIYNLNGQSSVARSFDQPIETFESIALTTFNLLEAIRHSSRPTRIYNACSSECFGETGKYAANEDTSFRPMSPYAIAKAAAFWAVANYRESYNLWACSGILFNHDSPLRPEHFVTRKIVGAACRIARGSHERLCLGSLSVVRDWGWAPEYVEAMWKLLQQDSPHDYIVATGKAFSLEKFVSEAFSTVGLDWENHVDIDPDLTRRSDPNCIRGDPSRIAQDLGWIASCGILDIVRQLTCAEQCANEALTTEQMQTNTENEG